MNTNLNDRFTIGLLKNVGVSKAIGVILLISVLAFTFLLWLIYIKGGAENRLAWVDQLPALNALLNSTSAILIVFGYVSVRKRKFARHMKLMLTAFVTSSFFLISYLIYHHYAGDTPFPGQGFIRPVYFTILISHIVLSAFVLPLVLTSFYFAFSGKLKTHRKISKWTLPIWLYVSVTGVVIYFILNTYT